MEVGDIKRQIKEREALIGEIGIAVERILNMFEDLGTITERKEFSDHVYLRRNLSLGEFVFESTSGLSLFGGDRITIRFKKHLVLAVCNFSQLEVEKFSDDCDWQSRFAEMIGRVDKILSDKKEERAKKAKKEEQAAELAELEEQARRLGINGSR